MLKRDISQQILKMAQQLPVIGILGPRQSGKTTLSKELFPSYNYVSLEKPSILEFALKDPEGFLKEFRNNFAGIIIDEIQHAPKLFSYIQVIVDEEGKVGSFIVTGPQNFLLNEAISQSLAGRIALFTLLSLSLDEMKQNVIAPKNLEDYLLVGQYPRIYAENVDFSTWYDDYITTYLERDVRLIKNVTDLTRFRYFIQLCAGRVGQILNVNSLATDASIDTRTAKSWLSLLETSYIIFLLNPYYKNFNKRLIKSPKIYFYDSGLLCSLLGIESVGELKTHYARGSIFESAIISEFTKYFYNQNRNPRLYFWRDHRGEEIDCLIDRASYLFPVEIKSSMTIQDNFFTNIARFAEVGGELVKRSFVVYTGEEKQSRTVAEVVPWGQLELVYNNLKI